MGMFRKEVPHSSVYLTRYDMGNHWYPHMGWYYCCWWRIACLWFGLLKSMRLFSVMRSCVRSCNASTRHTVKPAQCVSS